MMVMIVSVILFIIVILMMASILLTMLVLVIAIVVVFVMSWFFAFNVLWFRVRGLSVSSFSWLRVWELVLCVLLSGRMLAMHAEGL